MRGLSLVSDYAFRKMIAAFAGDLDDRDSIRMVALLLDKQRGRLDLIARRHESHANFVKR